jgi:DNA repair protein RadC
MTTIAQTDLFMQDRKTANSRVKTYTVQKYRLTYVKERSNFNRIKICNRADVTDFCKQYLSPIPVENVCIIALDNGNNIIGYDTIEGATNQCAVYPSNVFRFLLSAAATSFIISHNHPAGSTRPSEADWQITERLQSIGKMLEIPLLDHIIITENDCVSLRDSSRWNTK